MTTVIIALCVAGLLAGAIAVGIALFEAGE